MEQPTQRINLVSIVRQINDLERAIEAPKFNTIIVHKDYVIVNWEEIPRKIWGSLPYKIPLITNTRIEYKKMLDSVWQEIQTHSDTTTSCCFYKINPIHNFSSCHQVYNYFWNEYNALEEDEFYDIRFCYENHHQNKHWVTLSSIAIPSLPPTFKFCGFLKNNITEPTPNECYLVIDNNDSEWKAYNNCLAVYSVNRGINGWIIYYPRKGWKIDNFYFNGTEWVDIKLKNSMINLYNNVSSKDVLFKILKYGFTKRFIRETTLNEYYEKYINNI